jgi:hypothetical protein
MFIPVQNISHFTALKNTRPLANPLFVERERECVCVPYNLFFLKEKTRAVLYVINYILLTDRKLFENGFTINRFQTVPF